MPITATNAFSGPYTADGATTRFDFDFQANAVSEVALTVDGVDLSLSLYEVTLNGDGTGYVDTTSPIVSGRVVVELRPEFQQESDWARFEPYFPDQIVPPLDAAARRAIYLKDKVEHALRMPFGEAGVTLPDADTRAGKYLYFGLDGAPLITSGASAPSALALPAGATLIGSDDGSSGSLWSTIAGFIAYLRSTAGATLVKLTDGATIQQAIGAAADVATLVAGSDTLVEGSTIRTADDFTFTVAAAAAADHDVETAGGAKLYAPRARIGVKELTPKMFGMVTEGGDASAAANAVALAKLVAAAEAVEHSTRVLIPAGTYTLPPSQQMKANNSEWVFAEGAIFKLHGTQATDDFLQISNPTNQIFRNFQVDANRAVQDETLFGSDNAGVLVVSPTDCLFDGVRVISSPAKGFAMVSAVGETSSRTILRGGRGGDCKTQVFLLDANNGTGFFSGCVVDDIVVGTTDHAGLAINDGVSDCEVRNVLCNVGAASVWDAVSVRDSTNLRLLNITGKGGRHGVHIFKGTLGCTDIDLSNVRGEGSNGSGVLLTAVQRARGNNIVGVNNAGAGVNLARITAGDERCEDIHLTNVAGIDTQGTPTQDYGIILGGTRRCSINGYTATGNTVANATLITGVNEDSRIEWSKTFTAAVPSVASSGTATVNIPITAPFLIEYLQIRSLRIEVGTTSLALQVSHVASFTATNIQVVVRNASGTTAYAGTLVAVVGSK